MANPYQPSYEAGQAAAQQIGNAGTLQVLMDQLVKGDKNKIEKILKDNRLPYFPYDPTRDDNAYEGIMDGISKYLESKGYKPEIYKSRRLARV